MLDIIIPTYNNIKGLKKTLLSIDFNPDINVTIIDDNSACKEYKEIIKEFPISIYYHLTNRGPGAARQTGLNFTNQPYVMFLDTGDYFISKIQIHEVLNTIKENPDVYWFEYQHLRGNIPSEETHARLHGRIFKRSFLEQFNISFCTNNIGSYANEDVGFVRMCRLALKRIELTEKNTHKKNIDKPLIVWDTSDLNSITRANNGSFSYEKQNIGLAINESHVIEWAELNLEPIYHYLIRDEICEIMVGLYYHFLCTLEERPEFKQEAWYGAKYFYINKFKPWMQNEYRGDFPYLQLAQSQMLVKIRKKFKNWDFKRAINIKNFLTELDENDHIPLYYYGENVHE